MSLKKKLFGFRTIKLFFDVTLIALLLFIVSFVALSAWDISRGGESVSGFALITESKADSIIIDGNVESLLKGVNVKLQPEGIKVSYSATTNQHKLVFVLWKIFYLLSLNIGLLFMAFVLFQIRNIINSVYRATRDVNVAISNCVFSTKNIKRLRYIACGFVLIPFVELLNYYLDKIFLENYIKIDSVSVLPTTGVSNISWEYIFVGLLFFVMIEVFRKGVSLQEENDLTV
ncbi:MAG: DUF2975 domain-containing protein [Bacteroidales bacterium]|nr:DUF2975 domain-containing protein [Bacteroidales bacterium]